MDMSLLRDSHRPSSIVTFRCGNDMIEVVQEFCYLGDVTRYILVISWP